jgi:DNA-binding MarR family transcriptional regulator
MTIQKLTNTGKTLQTLDNSFGLSRAELASRLGESRDTIRKTTTAMCKDGRVARVVGDDGIDIYNITEIGKESLAKELARSTGEMSSPFKQLDISMDEMGFTQEQIDNFTNKLMYARPKQHAWGVLVEEAEQRGFSKGYAIGVQEAQRAAYELGKDAVLKKLTAVLS